MIDLRAERAQERHLLLRDLVRGGADQLVAAQRRRHRERQPRVPRRRLDDRSSRLQLPFALARLDQREADAVLDRRARIERLDLGGDQGARRMKASQLDERRVPHGRQNVLVHRHKGPPRPHDNLRRSLTWRLWHDTEGPPGSRRGRFTRARSPDPTTGAVMQPIYQVSTYRQPALGVRVVVRLRTHHQPDAPRFGAQPRGARGRPRRALLRIGDVGDRRRDESPPGRAITWWCRKTSTAGPTGSSRGSSGSSASTFTWVDTTDLAAVERAVTAATKMLYVETPTNPVLGVTDLAGAAKIARKHKLRLVVDNTFMSPYFQNPIAFGSRHRRSLHDEVPERAQRQHRRLRRSRRARPTPSASRGCRTASAPSSRRWIPSSCCAGSRRSRSGWTATTPQGRKIAAWLTLSARSRPCTIPA